MPRRLGPPGGPLALILLLSGLGVCCESPLPRAFALVGALLAERAARPRTQTVLSLCYCPRLQRNMFGHTCPPIACPAPGTLPAVPRRRSSNLAHLPRALRCSPRL